MYKCLRINYSMKYYFYMRENLAIQRVDLFSIISMILAIFLLSRGGGGGFGGFSGGFGGFGGGLSGGGGAGRGF